MKTKELKVRPINEYCSCMPYLSKDMQFSHELLVRVENYELLNIWKNIYEKYKGYCEKHLEKVMPNWKDIPLDYFTEEMGIPYKGKRYANYDHPIFAYVDELVNDEASAFEKGGLSQGYLQNIPIIPATDCLFIPNSHLESITRKLSKKNLDIKIMANASIIDNEDAIIMLEYLRQYMCLVFAQRLDYLSLKYPKLRDQITDFSMFWENADFSNKEEESKLLKGFIDRMDSNKLTTLEFYKNVKDKNKKHSIKGAISEIHNILNGMTEENIKDELFHLDDTMKNNGLQIFGNPFESPITASVINEYLNLDYDGRFELYLYSDKEIISRKRAVNNKNAYLMALNKMIKKVNDDKSDKKYTLIIGFINYLD